MRILVCGSRKFDDFHVLDESLEDILGIKTNTVKSLLDIQGSCEIIHGGAKGTDTLAGEWAYVNNLVCHRYPALWHKHGRSAGPIRNKRMLEEGKPNLVVAFLAKDSIGTKNMIEQAEKAGVPVKVINI